METVEKAFFIALLLGLLIELYSQGVYSPDYGWVWDAQINIPEVIALTFGYAVLFTYPVKWLLDFFGWLRKRLAAALSRMTGLFRR